MYKKYVEPDFMPTRNEMLALIQEKIHYTTERETINASQALNRICAENVYSKNTLPNCPVSRLDGIGVRFSDFSDGIPNTSLWQEERDFYFSNMGTPLRDGFDTVIIIEEIDFDDAGRLKIHTAPTEKGQYVSPPGSHLVERELILSRGQKVSPAHIGLLAAGGIATVNVLKKPVTAILPTGNELVKPFQPVPTGKTVESNSLMLAAYLESWGAAPVIYPLISDDPDCILTEMQKAIDNSDIVLILAGSSKGTKDYTEDILNQLGEVLVPEMGHGPGRHSSLTLANGKPIVGIAGPSYGAQIFAELYLRPIVNRVLLQPYEPYETITVTLDNGFPVHEVDFCERVRIVRKADGYHASSMPGENRTIAKTVNRLNGNFYRPLGSGYQAGDQAEIELLCSRAFIPEENNEPKT